MALPSNLSQTTQAHLEELVTSQAQEGPHLEFKRDLPQKLDNDAKQEFLADVSAFANSGGGELIYGIAEDDNALAAAVVPQKIDVDVEIRRLQDFLLGLVEPRLPGVQMTAIQVRVSGDDGWAIAIRIPQSWAGPHRISVNRHFYLREGARKRQLDVPEIRGLFLRSENQSQQIRNFRTERLGKILSGDAPHKLVDGPVLVVHVIPTQAALGLVQIDPMPYESQRQLPILGSAAGPCRLNLDGALSVRNARPAGTHGYSQFFRNGYLESVQVLSPGGGRPKAVLPSLRYEEDLMRFVSNIRAELAHLGISQEFTIMLSLLRADEVELGIDRFNYMLDEQQGYFDRKTVVLPDVLLQGNAPEAEALKPLFDLVWQSAGLSRSFN